MARYLKMILQERVSALLALGWSERRVAREAGVHRNTVRRYSEEARAKCTKTPAEDLQQSGSSDSHSTAIRRPFAAAAFRDEILVAIQTGDSAQVIYQHLVESYGYVGSYDSVKRYVRHLKAGAPKRVVGVMHHAPGEEAQIDYFQGAPTLHPGTGTYKRPWVFRMTLCHSRHGYEEPVWKLDLPTFLVLHERAFRDLGGVVRVVRHDNMTAGVSRACQFDPDSNVRYLAFAAHWGFVPLPTRPYHPEENGKQERSGGYCKHNAYQKGQRFESLAEHFAHLRRWNERWARTRIHGTTRRQVHAHYTEADLPALQRCPAENFRLFECGTRKVHVDAHVEVGGAFYPVPLRLIGESVHVRWDSNLVRVSHGSAEVALHARIQPGHWAIAPGRDPGQLVSTQRSHLESLRRRCSDVGPELRSWADAAYEARGIRTFKLLQGVLGLAKTHSRAQMQRAARLALEQRRFRYASFKSLLAAPAPAPAEPERQLTATHPVIRPMTQYSLAGFTGSAVPVSFAKVDL
jgi:transposase